MVVDGNLVALPFWLNQIYGSDIEARISEKLLYELHTDVLAGYFPSEDSLVFFFCKRKLILHEDKMAYLVHLEQYGVLVFSMNWAAFYNGRNIFHIRDVTRQEIPFVVAVKTAGILQGIQIIYLLAGHRLFCNFYSFLFPQIFVEMKIVFCKLVVVVYSA